MAESFVSIIAQAITEKIGFVIVQEVGLACGAKNELERLKNVLTTIKAVLVDAEENQGKNHQLCDWLAKLKDVCYDADDIVDEFEYQALQRQVLSHASLKKKVLHFFSSSNPLPFSFKMGHRIKEVREKLSDIAEDRAKFSLQMIEAVKAPIVQRETHSFVSAFDVIGRDDDRENIMQLLMHSQEHQSISVIPIVGIGGLGKTTLAKLVYNDERVVQHFQKRMWVCVSNDFDLKKLTIKILNAAKDEEDARYDRLDMDRLQTLLRTALRGNKYLLVLDDVWNEDIGEWIELKNLLVNSGSGSKIMVTTRIKSIASFMGTLPPYELQGLPHEECLSLFLKWAFEEGEEKRHPHLVKIANDIVNKCKGVPLAARTLGSLLYSKFDQIDWLNVRDNEIWKLEQKQSDILPALRLSYEQLPSYLKNCFAYCSIFAKDFIFNSSWLVQLWIAQGLIRASESEQELEEIGIRYTKELLSRSFFEIHEERAFSYDLRIHDLVHDLALWVAQTECVAIKFTKQNVSKMVRHVAFHNYDDFHEEDFPRILEGLNKIRTIFFPYMGAIATESILKTCISNFRNIRMLDLRRADFDNLPNSISDLKHLRFLDLFGNARPKKLPNSLCKLYKLQVLVLEGCEGLEELPRDLGNLISLRCLWLTTKQRDLSREVKKGIGGMTSLRDLQLVRCNNLEYLFEGMENLSALRKLEITECDSLVRLPASLQHLPALEILGIYECDKLESIDGNGEDMRGLKKLRQLWIRKSPKLGALPEWLQGLASLEKLVIGECPQLSALPHHMHGLTALSYLNIEDCPELSSRCSPGRGEDWDKISDVSTIYLDGVKIQQSSST